MAFVRVCGGILAAFFALSFASEKAFAQTAAGHVFTAASEIHDNTATANTEVDLSESVLAIIEDARADLESTGNAGADTLFGNNWQLWDRGDTFGDTASDASGLSNDGTTLIDFGGVRGTMQAGDLVFYDAPIGDYDFTVRIYNIGTVLFAAEEVAAATITVAGENQFYLSTDDWTMTDTPSRDVFGYEEPNCADEFVLSEDGSICEREAEMPENETTDSVQTERGESKVRDNAWTAFGGALAVGVLSYLLSDGTLLGYSATPDFGYTLTESGYSVNAGGRVDFHKDRWHLYWTAGQTNANGDFGDFRYSSGGKWQGDIFAAAFSEKVQGKTADYDLSLSANYDGGIWKLSPVYRLHSRLGENESETKNALNLEGILRTNRWILRPSAGFQWRNAEDFADNARFGFSAVRNL